MNQTELGNVRSALRKLIGSYTSLQFGYQTSMEEDIYLLTNGGTNWDDEEVKNRYLLWKNIAEAEYEKVRGFLSIYDLPTWVQAVGNYQEQYYEEVLRIIGTSKCLDATMQTAIRQAHTRYKKLAEESLRDSREDKEISRQVRASLGLD